MKLAKREKYFVAIAASVIFVFLFMQLAIMPFIGKRSRLQKGIKNMEGEIREMRQWIDEYKTLEHGSQQIKGLITGRKSGFTLFSFLEEAAGEAQVKDRITYMKPSVAENAGSYKESLVEMKLETLTLKQLVAYLKRIETSEEVIIVKRISIKGNNKKSGYMDIVLQLMTFQN